MKTLGLLAGVGLILVFGCQERPHNIPPQTFTSEPVKAAEPAWGETVEGIRTRLSCERANLRIGEPMPLRLEMENLSTHDVQFRIYPPMVLEVRGPEGLQVPEILGPFQRVVSSKTLAAGSKRVLYDQYDLSRAYLITKPGRYLVEFKYLPRFSDLVPGRKLPESDVVSVGIPRSNTLVLQVAEGEPRLEDVITSKLLAALPDFSWQLSGARPIQTSHQGNPPPQGLVAHLSCCRKAEGIDFWFLPETLSDPMVNYGIIGEKPALLGHSQKYGFIYARTTVLAAEHWPDWQEKIKTALEIN